MGFQLPTSIFSYENPPPRQLQVVKAPRRRHWVPSKLNFSGMMILIKATKRITKISYETMIYYKITKKIVNYGDELYHLLFFVVSWWYEM